MAKSVVEFGNNLHAGYFCQGAGPGGGAELCVLPTNVRHESMMSSRSPAFILQDTCVKGGGGDAGANPRGWVCWFRGVFEA